MATIYDFVNAVPPSAPPPKAGVAAVPTGGAPREAVTGTFITPQALVSFPLAAGLVAGLWSGAQTLWAGADANWVALVIASVIGAFIFLITVNDDRVNLGDRWQIAIALFIGLINTFYLYLAAVGIDIAI